MATKACIARNKRRIESSTKNKAKRDHFKKIVANPSQHDIDKVFAAVRFLDKTRNDSSIRIRNRCELTGRPHGYYRKFKLSRIAIRDLASFGLLPGVVKSSW